MQVNQIFLDITFIKISQTHSIKNIVNMVNPKKGMLSFIFGMIFRMNLKNP